MVKRALTKSLKPSLSSLKVTELKTLCTACGLRKTPPVKASLIRYLRLAARTFQPIGPTARVLSIDLGLKNFAFSLLSPVPPSESSTEPAPVKTTSKSSKSKLRAPSEANPFTLASPITELRPVHVHTWHNLNLTLPTITSTAIKGTKTTKSTKNSTPSTTPPPSLEPPASAKVAASSQVAAELPGTADADETAVDPDAEDGGDAFSGDAFSPAALSTMTLAVIREILLPLRPTHILIERQRYRTQGKSHIGEWTLRVNTLEAILHAMFAALRVESAPVVAGKGGIGEVGEGEGEGGLKKRRRKKVENDYKVCSVLPHSVRAFLYPEGFSTTEKRGPKTEEDLEKKKSGKKLAAAKEMAKYRELKNSKVGLVVEWLADSKLVVPKTKQAREMKAAFLAMDKAKRKVDTALFKEVQEAKGKGKRARKSKKDKEAEAALTGSARGFKIDDLADSVVQGAVWLQWQRNLEGVVKEWPELLEDE